MKILKVVIFIFFLQIFDYCYSQNFAPVGIGSILPEKTANIIATGIGIGVISGECAVSVINGINFFHHKPASSNAIFGILLGAFQIAVISQLPSNERTVKTINIISGGCLIATSTLRLYTFKKDTNTALNLNLIPSSNRNFFVGLRFSHTFN